MHARRTGVMAPKMIDLGLPISEPAFATGASIGAAVGWLARGVDLLALFDADRRPLPLSKIYVRPGQGKYGVGLICLRDVPVGARICRCYPDYSKTVATSSLRSLPPEVRSTIHEIWDCFDDPPGELLSRHRAFTAHVPSQDARN